MSIKRLFIVAALALAVLLIGSAAFSLYVFATAEGQLVRALRSYEQLAIATGLETDAARAILIEVQEREGIASSSSPGFDRASVERGIDGLIGEIREEIGAIGDPQEQAAEAQEFVAAFSIRKDYQRLFGLLDARPRGAALGAEVFEQYAGLETRLSGVVTDEREEVAAAIAEVGAFRLRLRGYAVAATSVIVAAIFGAALLTYRFLMRPLRVLESGSAELAAGNIAHRIGPAGPPELRRLAARLNEMAARLEEQRNALRDSNERLEETVAERTAELADKAASLQRIDESRRLFFAKVGHELRTPLTVLLGEAEVALGTRSGDGAAYREALEHIEVHGEQLKRRIADLTALARSEDGRLDVRPEPVDLVALVRQSIEATRGYARANDVRLRLQAEATELRVPADADRLRQALAALLDNAIKFSPGGGDVELRITRGTGEVRLEVSDRGPGVRGEDLPRIKEAYFRGGDPGARAGSGLGLAVATWIAEQHGGRLEARNRDGGGLDVALVLPAGREETLGAA